MNIKFNFESITIFNHTIFIEGWLFGENEIVRQFTIRHPKTRKSLEIPCGLKSDDVAAVFGVKAATARFSCFSDSPFAHAETHELELVIHVGGQCHVIADFLREALLNESVHRTFGLFMAELAKLNAGCVIEIGSRARSGVTRKQMIPNRLEYIGIDILPGENVDMVLDAHWLADSVPPGSIDAIFCFSVFEHLLMPWKVALEFNRVLKPGGIGFIMTHQAWPIHDAPCDYWRFSDQAWKGLFNAATGFAILDSRMSDPAYLVPKLAYSDRPTGAEANNFMQSAVLFRKTSDTKLEWNVTPRDLGEDVYPV